MAQTDSVKTRADDDDSDITIIRFIHFISIMSIMTYETDGALTHIVLEWAHEQL